MYLIDVVEKIQFYVYIPATQNILSFKLFVASLLV